MKEDIMKDKALENLFQSARPVFDDTDKFMSQLNRKLEAVEFLRQHNEVCRRQYKCALVVAFFLGVVVGGGVLFLILSSPTDTPIFTFSARSSFLLLLEQYSRAIAATGISLLLCFGIACIVINLLDVLKIKTHQKAIMK